MTERPNDPAWPAAPPHGAMDPERMAALLDGPLDEAERDALLARLADDDEDLALFAEAAAIQRELEEEDAVAIPRIEPTEDEDVPGVLPLRPAARPARRVDRRLLAAAAVIAGVTLLPLTWRASQGGAVREPSHAVALLENPSAGLPEGWDEDGPWPRTRSRGEVVSEQGRPGRLGAYMVDLELAVRARDVENTRSLATRMSALLTDLPAGAVFAQDFDLIAARPDAPAAELLAKLETASGAVADAVGTERYALGAWAEAARLAAARRDAAFFREGRTARTLEDAEKRVGDEAEARAALMAIRAASASAAPDWTVLETETVRMLRAIGS